MQTIPASSHFHPSSDGTYIATILQSQLLIRSASSGQVIQTYPLPRNDGDLYRHLKWSGHRDTSNTGEKLRILVADNDTIRVFEVGNAQWKAVINGAAGNTGGIAQVSFGANENEVLVFSDLAYKVTIWSLVTSRGVEIRDPKSGSKGHDYRPKTQHLAILTREIAHDTLLILAPSTHEVLENVELSTIDAQGVKWSPDGRWLAIWDSSSAGYKVFIYTSDGHLFKTFGGGHTADNIGLGMRSLAWSPNSEHLAIGDYEDRIILLANNSFNPKVYFTISSSINPENMSVWEEQIQDLRIRSYANVTQPASPPSQSSLSGKGDSITGISLVRFSIDGTLLAARSDSTPSTLWLWSMQSRSPIAALIHHTVIRNIHWHPTIEDLVLVHCALDCPVIYLWKASWERPKILSPHLHKAGGRMEASWIFTPANDPPQFAIGNAQNYITASIDPAGELLIPQEPEELFGHGPDDRFDESLIDFSAIKIPHNDLTDGSNGLEDTFRFKHPPKLIS